MLKGLVNGLGDGFQYRCSPDKICLGAGGNKEKGPLPISNLPNARRFVDLCNVRKGLFFLEWEDDR